MPAESEYRTEHVAETPRGWRVRMKAPGPHSGHLVAIAFPPGRRKKGSGRLVEILHPAGERNPHCELRERILKNPHELIIFGNPSRYRARKLGREGVAMRTAATLYRKMSGLLAAGKVEESNKVRMRLARLNQEMGWVMADAARFAEGRLGRNPFDAYAKKHLTAWIKSQGYRGRERSEVRRKIISVVREHPDLLESPGARSWSELLRMAGNPSKLERQREARERAARIRDARLNPKTMRNLYHSETLREGSHQVVIWANTEAGPFHVQPYVNDGETIVREIGHGYKTLETAKKKARKWLSTGERNPGFWKHFTKGEKNFLSQRLHVPAPKSMEDVEAYKDTLRRIDEINAKYKRGEFSRDKAIDQQESAVRSIGAKLNPAHKGEGLFRFLGKRFKAKTVQQARRRAFKFTRLKEKRQRRNPDETQQAVRMFEHFHGRDPNDITEKHVSAAMRMDYTALGDLHKLRVSTPLGQLADFHFENDGVKLASSPDGKQLYCIGGNQNLTHCLDAQSLEKDFVDLGEALQVDYLARKIHGNYEPVVYYHKFGENTGERPQLAYDKLKKQIFFVGGNYFIDTTKRVSPGIEN